MELQAENANYYIMLCEYKDILYNTGALGGVTELGRNRIPTDKTSLKADREDWGWGFFESIILLDRF